MEPLRRRRPLLAGLMLAWFAVVSTGVPLALPRGDGGGRKAAEERFPCENCPCGCATAEHCWRNCCCHSMAERLAWAKREGVRPPESALDSAESAGLSVAEWRPPKGLGVTSVAAVEPVKSSCRACCCKCSAPPPQEPAADRAPAPRGVVVWRALACQGLEQLWLTVSGCPPAAIVTIDFFLESAPALGEAPRLFASRSISPPQPPPKSPAAC